MFKNNPLDKMVITQRFGVNQSTYSQFGLPGHNGCDFRTRFWDSPLGRRNVLVVEDGVVVDVRKDMRGYGFHVRVRHLDGSLTIYGHLSRIDVGLGQKITAGTRVGISGSTGFVTGPHLHLEYRLPGWEGKKANQYYGATDPLRYCPGPYRIL